MAVLGPALFVLPGAMWPLFVVLGAALLLWPLWRGGRQLIDAMLAGAHAEWQGSYYEYDGRQIRVLADADGALWICAADVLDALGMSGMGRDPARVRIAAGRDGLRRAPGTRLLCFTERGLAAWLERRTEPKVAAFERWLKSQVTGPQRRRRELAGISERTQTGPE